MSAKRTIKDSVFRHLMKNPKYIPQLHHALTNYPIASIKSVRLNTLSGVMVNACRNDLSYIVNGKAVILSEHQSTLNENMPVRFLIYAAKTYERQFNQDLIYRHKRQPIYSPDFFMLYNGTDPAPARQEIKLSEAFMLPSKSLELVVTVYNINYDLNYPILQLCPILREYSFFINRIRINQQEMPYGQAVKNAVEYCIKQGVLEEFLKKYESEVVDMATWQYNPETAVRIAREEGREEGRNEGRNEGRDEGILATAKNMLKANLDISTIMQCTNLSSERLATLRASLA